MTDERLKELRGLVKKHDRWKEEYTAFQEPPDKKMMMRFADAVPELLDEIDLLQKALDLVFEDRPEIEHVFEFAGIDPERLQRHRLGQYL